MSHSATAAPDASIFCAMAKPMPRAPPVTIAVRPFRSMVFMSARLKFHAIAALEPERRPRLCRCRDLEAKVLDDAADFRYLLGIALGELAGPDIERVLQSDAHIAA